ncbi:hypothetical protein BOX15_Mlig011236g2 [Macrostomum lignano]|uniref:Protein Abitram n=1 Tax=Macrostomum lignano TaxID=282301 RepID=A0A267DXI4_9PLAT|nr:hypothetical protein BOX15_Mlig011236g1 [Macrostomum lignano]PAA84475.1 hypothetical protein BOX15_Mlig011236g2 [Macrostomum lignano]
MSTAEFAPGRGQAVNGPHGPGCCADYLDGMLATDPVSRYYTRYETADGHVTVLVHSNRLLVLCLGLKHPVVTAGPAGLTAVDFGQRADSRVSGKRKRGGQFLRQGGQVCELRLSGSAHQPVRCPVSGKLIEVNPRLAAEPSLAVTEPVGQGYLCILAPSLSDWPKLLEPLVRCSPAAAEQSVTAEVVDS